MLLLLAGAAAVAVSLTQAQSANGVYDTDGDRLIEISNLEQLNAVRWDGDGNGHPEQSSGRLDYAEAFPTGDNQLVCDRSCNGYELARSLDFSFAGSYASGRVELDWTRGEGWIPIDAFGATFEGNDRTISNLYSDGTLQNRNMTGLFGQISNTGAVISNVGLLNAEITGQTFVGALVGHSRATISNSYSTGRVSGTGSDIGGLVGSSLGNVTGSHSEASVTGVGNGTRDVGGLVGETDNATVSLSYATGAVTGHEYVGGLVGTNDGNISESFSKSVVTGTGGYIGGLVGQNEGGVNLSYATGAVQGRYRVGGLVGMGEDGSLSSVYASGPVSGDRSVGGMVGYINDRVPLTFGYAVGGVSGTEFVGGLIGYIERARISSSYWNTDTAPRGAGSLEVVAGASGKTTAELQGPTGAMGIYATWSSRNWDFGNSSQYPALRADMNGDGTATAAEFGGQGRTPPLPPPTPTHTPTPPPSGERYMDFSMGAGHICLLRDDGVVECAGDNSHGQATPPDGGRYVKLDGGDTHTCGLREDGEVECWGSISGTYGKDAPPVPPPTPTPPGPTASPPPTAGPGPTQAPGGDSCLETLSANGSVIGEWGGSGSCQSEDPNRGYARYYSFTLASASEVTITLERASGEADTYLYLRQGDGIRSGEPLDYNDDSPDTTRSQIVARLGAGTYTIEATTYNPGETGLFTLSISGL